MPTHLVGDDPDQLLTHSNRLVKIKNNMKCQFKITNITKFMQREANLWWYFFSSMSCKTQEALWREKDSNTAKCNRLDMNWILKLEVQ